MSGSKDRGVQFWDPQTGHTQLMLQGHKNSGTSFHALTCGAQHLLPPVECLSLAETTANQVPVPFIYSHLCCA